MLRATVAEREESLSRWVSGVISANASACSPHSPATLVASKTLIVGEAANALSYKPLIISNSYTRAF